MCWDDEVEEWNVFRAETDARISVAQVHLAQKTGPKLGSVLVILESRLKSVSPN